MSSKVYSCEEGVAMFQTAGKVILPNPEPFNTSKSAQPQFTGLDGEQPVFKTPKLSMPKYPISPSAMPSKTTFPLEASAKLNVPTNPDKTLSDLCAAAQAWGIKAVEEKKSQVSLPLFLFPFCLIAHSFILTHHYFLRLLARQWKIPDHKSALSLFGSLEKISSDPKWPNTVNFKIPKAASLITGGTTSQDSKGKWKIDSMNWKESKEGPAQIVLESGKSYDAPRIFMALPGDGTKYTDKIISTDASGNKVKRFLNWGDVKNGSEIEIQFKFGKVWYTPMGISMSLEIVQALFYPPAPKSSTSFAGKRCVEPTDEELLAATEGVESGGAAEVNAESGAAGGGFVPTFEDDETNVEDSAEKPSEFTSPVKESNPSVAPGAPKKKRKTTHEDN